MFMAVVKDISQEMQTLEESGSEVSYLISKPRNFSEVNKFVRWHKQTFVKGNTKGFQKPK